MDSISSSLQDLWEEEIDLSPGSGAAALENKTFSKALISTELNYEEYRHIYFPSAPEQA